MTWQPDADGSRWVPKIRRGAVGPQPNSTSQKNDSRCLKIVDTFRCVDGVCCDSACGLGDGSDCQACAVAAGAARDGCLRDMFVENGTPCPDGTCQDGACLTAAPPSTAVRRPTASVPKVGGGCSCDATGSTNLPWLPVLLLTSGFARVFRRKRR